VVIDTNDNVTGTDTVSTPGTTNTDTGSISENGQLTLSITKAGTTTQIGTITANLANTTNNLEGTGSLTISSVSTPIIVNLSLTSSATAKPKSTEPAPLTTK
jgi:hypothetical protein